MRRTYVALFIAAALGCRDNSPLPLADRVGPALDPSDYEVVALGNLPSPAGPASEAAGINNRGQVVGWSGPGLPEPGRVDHAFLWQDGVMTDLGTLGGNSGRALFINDAGQIAGWSTTPGDTDVHAFLWRDSVMTDLGTLGGTSSQPAGLNASGMVVGHSSTTTGATHAFVWRGGSITDLGTLGGDYSSALAVNDRGDVVGESQTAAGQIHAFWWDGNTLHDLGTLGGATSTAHAVNNAGAITGTSTDSAGQSHAFSWQDGVMLALPGPPGSTSGNGTVITNSGHAAGTVNGPGSFDVHGILWIQGQNVDLGSFFPSRPRTVPVAINERGQVAGAGTVNGSLSSLHAFIWEDGTLRDPGVPAGFNTSWANAVDQRGNLVGWMSRSAAPSSDTRTAVLWRLRRGGPATP